MHALYRFIAVGFAGTLLWAACGGDDNNGSSEDMTALCKQTCDKLVACWDGGLPIDCNAACAPRDGGGGSGGQCKDVDAQVAHLKGCLQKDCKDLSACFESAPCNGGGGAGGAGGAGGSTGGSGGSTGGAGGSTGGTGGGSGDGPSCASLLACCNAITNEMIKPTCLMMHMQANGNEAVCAATYSGFKMGGLCP
jgi:hypothetical protein